MSRGGVRRGGDTQRGQQEKAEDQKREQAAERLQQRRRSALAGVQRRAEQYARFLEANEWSSPLDSYDITATFGQVSSLWSSSHTGLDFAAPMGTPIRAVASGTVTDAGYSGAYGERTIVTTEDGTEFWYCHQSSILVAEGQEVDSRDIIGEVGATGNVTGPHLHLEIRPGGGEPIDPAEAMDDQGVTP